MDQGRRRGVAGPDTDDQTVIGLLRASTEPMTVAALAERLGLHPNTVRYRLDGLRATGRVAVVDTERASSGATRPGRPAQRYVAVPGMDPAGPRDYRLLADLLGRSLSSTPGAADLAAAAGRTYGAEIVDRQRSDQRATGRSPDDGSAVDHTGVDHADVDHSDVDHSADGREPEQAAVEQLLELLERLDFAPEHRAARSIDLMNCPFLEVARGAESVVCAAHLGLMRGALQQGRAPLTVEALVPFAAPDRCRVELVAAAGER